MKKPTLHFLALALLLGAPALDATASTVSATDPQTGGIGYKYTVTLGGLDTAIVSDHVGAWSWQDASLFNAAAGETPVGWTHTSNWVAVNLTVTSVFKIRLERNANVPWPSVNNPGRLASVASLYPSFTIWKKWDNDTAPQSFIDAFNEGNPTQDWHSYNNKGPVEWAEDLEFVSSYNDVPAFVNNSSAESIERTYILPAGQYTIVIGSNAPATDTNRQGYKATFTTTQELPVIITDESYFVASPSKALVIPAAKGVLANDAGLEAADTLQVVTPPTKGNLTLNHDGSFTYTPGAYFSVAGFDSFRYRLLIDGDANTSTTIGTATISTFIAAAGTHAGHVKDEDTDAIAGLVKLDVTRTGQWTAAIAHLGKRYSLRGSLGLQGDLVVKGKPPLDIELTLATHGDGDRHAHAHIHGTAAHYAAHVDKSPFSKESPPPFEGRHKVALTVATSSSGAPQAAGTGTLTITDTGMATLVAKLGDKTAITCGSALIQGTGDGPMLPIYAAAYRKPIGHLVGELTFGAMAESNATGSLALLKPPQTAPAAPGFTISYGVTTSTP